MAFSVDLEPNPDGSYVGVAEAMDWVDDLVPRSTVYTTYRVATEKPDLVAALAEGHQLGVHVHPREFGHDHDSLAALPRGRQRELITETRRAIADAAGISTAELTAFRAGRHQVSEETLDVLAALEFTVDASIHVRYRDHLPAALAARHGPFELDTGLVELPTTYGYPPVFSRARLWTFPRGVVTATAHALRTDSVGCSGHRALSWLCSSADAVVSMYMHPYDATDYAAIHNGGATFRRRLQRLLERYHGEFVTASDVYHATT
jgi:transcriptional regulator with XRE-family HTH domain